MSESGESVRPGRSGHRSTRTEARERALTLLYEAEQRGESVSAVGVGHSGYLQGLSGEIALGAEKRRDEIDAMLAAASASWPLERMAAVDRAVLRIATYELLERPDTPTAVIIDEAVELAKRFSTESSGRFVNGVLSAVGKTVRQQG